MRHAIAALIKLAIAIARDGILHGQMIRTQAGLHLNQGAQRQTRRLNGQSGINSRQYWLLALHIPLLSARQRSSMG